MSKPLNKTELIDVSQVNFKRLNELVDSYSKTEQESEFPDKYLNRNIRDVLAHLHHWHTMFFKWYRSGMNGDKPDMPAKGYTWKQTPELNKVIQILYSSDKLDSIRIELNSSFNQLQEIIQSHTDNELFEKKRYNWTGSTSLGAYLIANSSSHYDWAYKLIKKAKREAA
ncbi:ClbS/DfsB family four-helix bundle protein [Balneola sp. MJW-20]|uniref:ClbS/DfsB family four-helix bundle protein n=1 Tax=Gracilimonas aurantiaca TaxID=3234185 RepID=UPI00346536FE